MVNEQIQAKLCEASLTLKKKVAFQCSTDFAEQHLKTTQYLLNASQVKHAYEYDFSELHVKPN